MPHRPRVALLTYTLGWGGTEIHTCHLARALAQAGAEVRIVQIGHRVYQERAELDPGTVPLPLASLPHPLPLVELTRRLRALRADVLVLAKGAWWVGEWELYLAARAAGRRFVTIEHLTPDPTPPPQPTRHLGGLVPGLGLWRRRERWRRWWRGRVPHRAVAVSDAVGQGLIEHLGCPADKVVVVRNGVDLTRFRPDQACRARQRARLGIPERATVVGVVGRLDDVKQPLLALDVFLAATRRHPSGDEHLVIVGDGPLSDLVALRAASHPEVHLVGWQAGTWEWYPVLDVFLQASAKEGLPLALLEAVACGCVPVAFGVGGVPEVFEVLGLPGLAAPGDAAALGARLEAAISGAAPLPPGAMTRLKAEFSLEQQLERLVEAVLG